MVVDQLQAWCLYVQCRILLSKSHPFISPVGSSATQIDFTVHFPSLFKLSNLFSLFNSDTLHSGTFPLFAVDRMSPPPPRIFPTSDCTAAQRASTTNLNLQPSGAILYCSIPCRLIFLFQYCSLAVRCVYEVPLPPPTVVAVLSFISVSSGSEQVVFGFQVFVVRFHIIHSPLFNISKASCSGKQPYCIAWISICICYTRFYKALDLQDIDRIDRDLRGWFQPYMA